MKAKKAMKATLAWLLALALAILMPLSGLAETNTAGEMPGEPPSGGMPGGDFPGEPPSGEMPGGEMPGEPPSGEMPGEPPSGGMPGGQSGSFEYAAATTITEAAEATGETYASGTADESALIVDTEGEVALTDLTVTKTGDSDGGDNCNFYGLNAAVLAMGGGSTVIEGGTVTSDASGANGVFCYGGNGGQNGAEGDGTTLIITGTAITTTGDGSGGIMTTGGGTTYAYGLTVDTSGRSSAAIRTDRGGGTVVVDGGTYTSNGLGSPAIYRSEEHTSELQSRE